jgi:hypothetical protein
VEGNRYDSGNRSGLEARGTVRQFIFQHRRVILVGWTLLLLCLLFAMSEILLRLTVPYRIDYYTGRRTSAKLVKYPWGDMPFNSNGYPDREWDARDSRERVGFLGDSVTMGFGAGYGYRFSEIVGARCTHRYYMNFGGAGEDGIANDEVAEGIVATARRFHLVKLIYVMNLNDIQPSRMEGDRGTALEVATSFVSRHLDALRGRSYAYNYFRTRVKYAATRLGYEYHGVEAFELHPARNSGIVEQTCSRINKLWERLKLSRIDFCVVLLPYEMQISSDAADRYRQLGIHWGSEVLRGEPQATIHKLLSQDIGVVDVREAFDTPELRASDIRVGEYFVYDKGDKLDWNHPNRRGHELIARYLLNCAAECIDCMEVPVNVDETPGP